MDAAEAIYLDYIEPIKDRMKVCIYRIVKDPDDAADAFQNALFKIWNYLDRIMNHPNPQAYILSICVSSAHDLLRTRSRQSGHEMPLIPEIAADAPSPFRPGYSNEIIAIVQHAIASMSLKQAQAVFLRLFENESYSVISDALGCTEETARSHVSKGLANLRSILLKRNISMREAYS
ncbi:MAG: sigma-70 family RNA polymerase sigma factor [Candidatus Omnitrophica bacterium]|nr:sigma-70 family RNA polymerase sigma factor [Candidatus Omnitrophota bacterium]